MLPVVTHYSEAFKRVVTQYKRSEFNVGGIIRVLCEPAQLLENVTVDLYNLHSPSTAFGAMLDNLGAILGVSRGGWNDDEYRAYLYIRIGALNSEATAEDLVSVFRSLMVPKHVDYDEVYPAEIHLTALDATPICDLNLVRQALEKAKAGGVALVLKISNSPAFGFAPADLGFGDATDPTAGGGFSAIF